ncbi:MAG: copper amine oxidase N-terminal domain-containing protein [Desulfotomaculales bacterium]
MIRKMIFVAIFFTALVFSFVGPVQATPAHEVVFKVGRGYYIVDGQKNWMDAATFIENDRTYVPVRYLAYVLGVNENDIKYDNGIVALTLNGKTITMVEGSKVLKVDNNVINMDVAPIIKDGRIYLPARYVAEVFGYKVDWFEPIGWVMIRDEATWKAAQPKLIDDNTGKPKFKAVAFPQEGNKVMWLREYVTSETKSLTEIIDKEISLPGPAILNFDYNSDIRFSVVNLLLGVGVPPGAMHWDDDTKTLLVECDYVNYIEKYVSKKDEIMHYLWIKDGDTEIYAYGVTSQGPRVGPRLRLWQHTPFKIDSQYGLLGGEQNNASGLIYLVYFNELGDTAPAAFIYDENWIEKWRQHNYNLTGPLVFNIVQELQLQSSAPSKPPQKTDGASQQFPLNSTELDKMVRYGKLIAVEPGKVTLKVERGGGDIGQTIDLSINEYTSIQIGIYAFGVNKPGEKTDLTKWFKVGDTVHALVKDGQALSLYRELRPGEQLPPIQ